MKGVHFYRVTVPSCTAVVTTILLLVLSVFSSCLGMDPTNENVLTSDWLRIVQGGTCGNRRTFWSINSPVRIVNQYVIGGGPTLPFQYPFFVSVTTHATLRTWRGMCGGSLISTTHVLTAAHCVSNRKTGAPFAMTNVKVYVTPFFAFGAYLPYPIPQHISELAIHPEFDYVSLRADLAILTLAIPTTLLPGVSPICLPSPDLTIVEGTDHVFEIVGHGATVASTGSDQILGGSARPIILEFGTMKLVNIDQCRRASGVNFHDGYHLCGGGLTSQSNICFGDSGGPLLAVHGGKMTVIGVSSFITTAACKRDTYAGFTNVSHFLPWIIKTMSTSRSWIDRLADLLSSNYVHEYRKLTSLL